MEKLLQFIKTIFISAISGSILLFSCRGNTNTYQKSQPFQKEAPQNSTGASNVKFHDTIPNSLEFFNNVGALGIGLLKVNNVDTLTIIKNNEKSIEKIYTPTITPIFFKPDYGIFYLVCVSEQKSNYKIQTSTNQTAILPKTKNIQFLSWDRFLLSTTGISNLDWKENPFRKEPDTKATIQEVSKEDDFTVIKVHNEWIQISTDSDSIGWIKWKQDGKLLIEIYLLM